jgi:hypothetical protein
MWLFRNCEINRARRFFYVRYSGDSLLGLYKVMYKLNKWYNYSWDIIYAMIPYELEILLSFIEADNDKDE